MKRGVKQPNRTRHNNTNGHDSILALERRARQAAARAGFDVMHHNLNDLFNCEYLSESDKKELQRRLWAFDDCNASMLIQPGLRRILGTRNEDV